MTELKNKATRSQSRNDLCWEWCGRVGTVETQRYSDSNRRECAFFRLLWSGYDDANWWKNVATDKSRFIKTVYCCSCCKGHKVILDPLTNTVYESIE